MRLLGATSISELGPQFVGLLALYQTLYFRGQAKFLTIRQVNARTVERDIYDGEPNLDRSGLWEKPAVMKSKL